jgi:hypothetical protein
MANARTNGLDAPKLTAKVTIGKAEYEIQWGPLTEYILSTRNLTLQNVLDSAKRQEGKWFALGLELLSAMMAHGYPSGEHPKAQELAARLLPTEAGKPSQFAEAFNRTLSYLREVGAVTPLPEAPKNDPAPEQTPAPLVTQ